MIINVIFVIIIIQSRVKWFPLLWYWCKIRFL